MPRNCFSCKTDLNHSLYYSKHGQSYCKNCYEVEFCPTCRRCNEKIKIGQKGLTWNDRPWHDSCFNCTQCNVSLLQRLKSFEKKNLPYCTNCYNLLFSPKCDKCSGIIESGTSWIKVKGNKLHPDCFKCAKCNTSLANRTYCEHNGMSYCLNCDTQQFCPKCALCGQAIHRGTTYLDMDGQKIHNTCFTCFTCGQMIEGFHQNKNGHHYHPHCVDNTYFRARRTSFHGAFNNDQTLWDQTNNKDRPTRNTQQTVDDPLVTITPLNLRSSTARNTRLDRSTTNLSNYLNTVEQFINDALLQPSLKTASDVQQNNSDIEEFPNSRLQIPQLPRSIAPQHRSDQTKQRFEEQTAKNLFKPTQPDGRFERQKRSRSSRRRISMPSPTLQNIIMNPINHPNNSLPPKPLPRKTRTCQVCFEEKPVSLYAQPVSRQCRHRERTICNDCIYQHITQAFQKMCTDDVRCPELDCRIILDYDAIKKILLDAHNTNLFERYDRFHLERQLERMPEFIWCAHGCGSGQLADHGMENNIVTCIKCSKKSCFTHRTKWHDGFTCESYDAQTDPGRRATEQWLAQKTKNCPNCQSSIEKKSGCDHMTCTQCHFEFCWACLANYANIRQHGNHHHYNTCKHFAPYND